MRSRQFALMAASVLALTALCAPSVVAQGGGEGKRVLLLFSHQADQYGQLLIDQGIRSTLRAGSSDSLEIYSEYLDYEHTQLDDYEIELVGHLNRKYKDKKFDLLFAVNAPALKFLLKNRAAFFPDAPIVFHVLDQRDLNGLDLGSNVTGVWGEVNFKTTVEQALALHPGTRRVVVITGVSDLDNYLRNRAQGELRDFEGSVEVSHLIGLTTPELKTALADLPPQTIVLFAVVTRDKAGNNTDNLEVVRQICPASSAPVYGGAFPQLGLGIVGGKFTNFEVSGFEGQAPHRGLQ